MTENDAAPKLSDAIAGGAVGLGPRLLAAAWFAVTACIPIVAFFGIIGGGLFVRSTDALDPFVASMFIGTPIAMAAFFGFVFGSRIVNDGIVKGGGKAALHGLVVGVLSYVGFMLTYALVVLSHGRAGLEQATIGSFFSIFFIGAVLVGWLIVLAGSVSGWMLFRFSNNSLSAPLTTWATKSAARRLNCFALAALLVVLFLLWLPVRSQYQHEGAQEAQRDLFQAVWGNNPERVTELLASGLSANSVDVAGIPLLVTAAEQGNTRVVSILLENGANPNVKGVHNPHATPLHLAAQNFDVESIKRLVERQANVNASDDYGRTPLMFAAVNTDRDTVQFLIDHGAAVNSQASDGMTALGWVKQFRDSAGNRDCTDHPNPGGDAGRNFGDSRDYENPMIIKRARERHDAIIEMLKSYGAQ